MLKMQEHGIAQFGEGHPMSKSQYAMQVAEMEEKERLLRAKKNYFPDFDYVNPDTKERHGETSRDRKRRLAAMASTTRSLTKMKQFMRKGRNSSMGRNYESLDQGSAFKKMPAVAGGKRSPIRALAANDPYLKK